MTDPPARSFRCPVCEITSFNPGDVLWGYCANCHQFTGTRSAPSEFAESGWDHTLSLFINRPMFFDREGHPIDYMRFGELLENEEYKRVAADTVGVAWISTVWIGIDTNVFAGPPTIFETMIFGGAHDQDQMRYASEADALQGHRWAVEDIREGREPWAMSLDVEQPVCAICKGDWHGLEHSSTGCPGEFAPEAEIKEWLRHHDR